MFNDDLKYQDFFDDYKRDVFIMLKALGYERAQAGFMIKNNTDFLTKCLGTNIKSGPVVTPQLAARKLIELADM